MHMLHIYSYTALARSSYILTLIVAILKWSINLPTVHHANLYMYFAWCSFIYDTRIQYGDHRGWKAYNLLTEILKSIQHPVLCKSLDSWVHLEFIYFHISLGKWKTGVVIYWHCKLNKICESLFSSFKNDHIISCDRSYHILSYHNMMPESVIDDSLSSYSNVNASRNIDPVWLNLWDWG